MEFEISSIHPKHYSSSYKGKEIYNYKQFPVEGTAVGFRALEDKGIGKLICEAKEEMFRKASTYN